MAYVRSGVALLLIVLYSVVVLFVVLKERDTGVITVLTPPVMLAVGYFLGGDLKKAWRNGDE